MPTKKEMETTIQNLDKEVKRLTEQDVKSAAEVVELKKRLGFLMQRNDENEVLLNFYRLKK